MRRRLASLLALGSLLLPSRLAHAQRVDPEGEPTEPRSQAAIDDERALLALAGPRARVRRDEQGRVRMLWGARVQPWSSDRARDAVVLTQRFGEALGIPQGADLRVERVASWNGFTVVRLRRFADGRPVLGASVVVRSLADGAIDLVLADAGPARIERGATSITPERATELAAGVSAGFAVESTTTPLATALSVADAIVPVWSVDVHGAALSQRSRAFLDARDGELIALVPLATHATGRVYETNPTTTMGATTDVDIAHLTSAERLTGEFFRVQSCNAQSRGCAPMQLAQADAEGNFLYDPDPRAFDDPFAEVNAYYHLNRAAEFHRDRNGFTWQCGGGSVMRALVNYTETRNVAFDNAAFSPASGSECGFLLFGQSTNSDFAYDADVVYHEFGHAVTDQVASMIGFLSDPLGVSYEPLAVNEGTSDYYAATLQGNAQIAESFAGLGSIGSSGSLRVIDGELGCPGALFGEGHYDGRIWAGAGWELREALGAELTDVLVFTTVASITDDPSLAEAGALLVATADGMAAMGALSEAEAAMVESIVGARGLPSCERIVALDEGSTRQGWSGSEFLTASLGRGVAPVHYRIEVPADATSLRFDVSSLTPTGNFRLHFRADRPVRVATGRTSADAAIAVDGSVVLDETSQYVLPRCRTLYVAIESTDLRMRGQNVHRIKATLERSGDENAECPVLLPDAGPASPDAGADGGVVTATGDGCSCRVGSASDGQGAGLGVLLVGAAIAVRRRRAR